MLFEKEVQEFRSPSTKSPFPASFPATPPKSSSVFTECGTNQSPAFCSRHFSQLTLSPEPNPQSSDLKRKEVVSYLIGTARNFKRKLQNFEDVKLNQVRYKLGEHVFNQVDVRHLRYLIRNEAYYGEKVGSLLKRVLAEKENIIVLDVFVSALIGAAHNFKVQFQKFEDERLNKVRIMMEEQLFNQMARCI